MEFLPSFLKCHFVGKPVLASGYVGCLVRLFISLTVVSEFRVDLDSGYHAVNSGFQLLKSGSLVSGTWPPDSNR